MLWDDGQLLVLDPEARALHTFELGKDGQVTAGPTRPLPSVKDAVGLAGRHDHGEPALYTLVPGPSLVRIGRKELQTIPLRGLEGREVYGLAFTEDSLFVTYDPGDQPTSAGLARYDRDWETPVILPVSGRQEGGKIVPTTTMATTYFPVPSTWPGFPGVGCGGDPIPTLVLATGDQAYLADAPTGRGLWTMPLPGAASALAAHDGKLWAAWSSRGEVQLAALELPYEPGHTTYGPWKMRDVELSIAMEPKGPEGSGWLQHTMNLPAQLDTQRRLSWAAQDGPLTTLPWAPAGDPAAPMLSVQARWEPAPAGTYHSSVASRVLWRERRSPVIPHAVVGGYPLPGYLQDDPIYGLEHTEVFDAFVDRVVAYIASSYGLSEDEARLEMHFPYWAARNTVDYIFSTYWYPDDEVEAPADLENGIFASNPGWAKAAASQGPPDGDEILMCAGASTLFDAVMRHLGHEARWVGSVYASGPDTDRDGFLEPGERQKGVNGHRWAEVWLGAWYGWRAFDATPISHAIAGHTGRPPRPSQWDLMQQCAGPTENKIVTSIGSGKLEHAGGKGGSARSYSALHDLAEPCAAGACGKLEHAGGKGGSARSYSALHDLAEPCAAGACGKLEHAGGKLGPRFHGEQAYNMLGTAQQPEHRVSFANPLGVQVSAERAGRELRVSWTLQGPWHQLPGAQIEVWLLGQRREILLAPGLPAEQGSATFSWPNGSGWQVRVRLVGDPQTGATTRL